MNILGFNISRAHRSAPAPAPQPLSPGAAWFQGDDVRPGPGLSSAYEQVVWVYRAINVLAEQIANIPFVFSHGARGRESLITSGPLIDFYNHPHPFLNRFQYWELRVLWLMLRGESVRIPIYVNPNPAIAAAEGPFPDSANPIPAHGYHVKTSTSKLKSVLILDPARFEHIVENHTLIGWRYRAGAKAPLDSFVFFPEEVWFERLPNPFDFWRGLSPLSVADLAVHTDFAAASFMRGLIENNAESGLIFRSDAQISDDQREQIRAALRIRKRRAGSADDPILLWGVNEIIQPRISSADLQFLENRKLSRAEICAAFGVPEEILTSTDNSKYDVMQGARLNFIENRVAPLCARLQAEEQATVKAIDPKAVGWFDLDSLPIMQNARRERIVAAKTAFDIGIPFNELNRVLDLGFKSLPWGNNGFLPSKYHSLSSTGPNGAQTLAAPEDLLKGCVPIPRSKT